jgi:hypothetical protein
MPGRQTRTLGAVVGLLLALLLPPFFVRAQDVGVAAAAEKTAQYKAWLDQLREGEFNYWTRVDETRRPFQLYVAEGFLKAEFKYQEEFVEIFSHYLAGHPQKYMLIDLYDSESGQPVGEYGWSGFKLFTTASDFLPEDRGLEANPRG